MIEETPTERCLRLIREAASRSETHEVIRLSSLLREMDEIQQVELTLETRKARAMEELSNRVSESKGSFRDLTAKSIESRTARKSTSVREDGLAARSRAKGKIARDKFVTEAKSHGKSLILIRGTNYQDSHGGKLGIAFATERQPDRWFLGLKDEDFATIVLMCEDLNGIVRRFVLPREVCTSIHDDLSRDQLGNVKFNVTREGGRYYLTLAGRNLEISKYLDFFNGIACS